MRNDLMRNLADCPELRQAVQARPPRLAHGTAGLVALLLGTALAWSAVTEADLVVRAPGEVRPVTSLVKVLVPVRGQGSSASFGGRVVAVNVKQGQQVRRGDVLIELDTAQLDIEIAKLQRTIQAAEEELAHLEKEQTLLHRQFLADQAKAGAEVKEEEERLRLERAKQELDIRFLENELADAETKRDATRRLVAARAASLDDLRRDEAGVRRARAARAKAELPLCEGKLQVLRLALDSLAKAYALKDEDMRLRQGTKRGEWEAARKDLANLERERQQAVIRSPSDGIVTAADIKVGEVRKPGELVAEVAEQRGYRFEVQVASEDIAHLREGMPARVKLNALDYQTYGTADGTVDFISPDSGSEPGRPPASYRVGIELKGDEIGRGECRGRFKFGMAGRAEIVSGQESILSLLVKGIRQAVSLG